uniref:Capsid protein n=1 Tax=Beihai levi-like virus 25 TaxID=1922411 RepID=A0A1L3KHT9_9VIRU|nr:hypothetical protein [Beihai levi-like virus 25]
MPQLQQLVLTDRADTPVSHTFTPVDIQQNVGTVSERTGSPVADPIYSISNRRSGDNYKVTIKMSVPVVQNETVNGISRPVVVRSAYVQATFTFSKDSTEEERNNVVGMFADSFGTGKTLVNDTLVKLEGVY